MGLCQSAQDACMSAQKQAEDGVRAAGGGDALDAAKEKAADGIPVGFGKTFDIPDLATKGGECHVGVKYVCVEGKTVDAQFCAIEFNKKGEKLGSASYEVNETPDGALKYLGDTYGAEGGSEYVSLKLGDLGDDVQAIVMCIYIWNDCVMDDYADVKLGQRRDVRLLDVDGRRLVGFDALRAGVDVVALVVPARVHGPADGLADALGRPAAEERVHGASKQP